MLDLGIDPKLAWALGHRTLVLGGTLALFVVVILLYGRFHHGTELFPETDPRQIWASVETPPGTRLEQTDSIVRELERRLGDLPDIRVRSAASGSGATGDEFSGGRRWNRRWLSVWHAGQAALRSSRRRAVVDAGSGREPKVADAICDGPRQEYRIAWNDVFQPHVLCV